MALYTVAEALEALVEAVTFSDIYADVSAIDIYELLQGVRTGAGYVTQAGIREVGGALGAIAGAALPGVINSFAPEERSNTFTTPARPPAGHRRGIGRLAISPAGVMPTGGKKRSRNRSPNKKKKRSKTSSVSVKKTHLAGSKKRAKDVHYISRLQVAPTPTAMEAGGALTYLLSNATGKTTGNGTFSFGYSFKLDQVESFAEQTAIYQWYKILGVKITFYPLQSEYPSLQQGSSTYPIKAVAYSGATSIASASPQLIVAPDESTDALFANESIALAHGGARFHIFNDASELTVNVYPKPTGLLGETGTPTVYRPSKSEWISTASTTTPHYGLRCYATGWSNAVQLKVMAEYRLAFKDLKH